MFFISILPCRADVNSLLTRRAKNATVLRVIKMEKWDAYSVDRIPLGRSVVRGERHDEGLYRMVVHAAIFNSEGRLLIQQRCTQKKTFPEKWDVTVGGGSLCGETSREAMQRELREELGLDIDFSELRPRLTVNFDDGFDDYYIIEKNLSLDSLRLQTEEVMDVRWATLDEIFGMIDSGEFIPFMKSFIAFLFEMRSGTDNLNM